MMPKLTRIMLLGLAIEALVGCGEQAASSSAAAPAQPPSYTVVARRDASIGAVKRLQIKVSLPSHYSRDVVESVAQAIVTDTTKTQAVNGISMLFYGPGSAIEGVYDVAMVDWAPNGEWARASSVRAGDYATFRYVVSYKTPQTASTTASELTAGDHKGLLGVPLPSGAQLAERTPSDPASARDASERYSISASAVEIAASFNRALPAAGWAKDGASTSTALFFRKGRLMMGVLINGKGATFTLIGS